MNIEVKGTAVFRDGDEVGTVNLATGEFSPIEGLNGNTVKAIEKHLASRPGEGSDSQAPKAKPAAPEPAQDPKFGDKTPAYVEWYRKTHGQAAFDEKYGHRRHPGNISEREPEPVEEEQE